VVLSPEAIRERLDRWPVARLATTGASGRPHQVPIVFARVGECLWSPVDGKPKKGSELARVWNIRERPEVCLLLDEYTDDWERLWWLRIDASSRVIQPAAPQQDAAFRAAQRALRAKYPQYEDVAVSQSRATMLVFDFDVRHIRSWCASASGQNPSG
jgi:PPOX class probable F420-dependent enzyme